jgi:hypothetical protein
MVIASAFSLPVASNGADCRDAATPPNSDSCRRYQQSMTETVFIPAIGARLCYRSRFPGMSSEAKAMRAVGHFFICALMLWVLPLSGTAQDEAAGQAEKEQRAALAESFAELVFGFCSALVSQPGTPQLDRVSSGVTLRGPFPLSEAGPLSGPLADRLRAKPDAMVYAATTPAVAVGRFQIAYALADGSACVALAQDMPDVVSKISARIVSDTQYELQSEGAERFVYVGKGDGGERSITISVPSTFRESGIDDVEVRRNAR